MKRRSLTIDEKAEAEKLANAWKKFKEGHAGATQEWLAAESGLGTQGAVGQYLRGVIPLNIEALMAVSRVIGINPADVSPRLTAIVGDLLTERKDTNDAVPEIGDSLDVACKTAAELRLLSSYRLANDEQRAVIDIAVNQVLRMIRIEGNRNQG